MIYIYINKTTNEPRAFGSLVALCYALELKKDRFYTHFGRNKNTSYENDDYRIVKLAIERSTN